jgi:dienelactone hydrolase
MENITTSNVKFGFMATPSEKGPYPGVLVLQEWWGMNDHIKGHHQASG